LLIKSLGQVRVQRLCHLYDSMLLNDQVVPTTHNQGVTNEPISKTNTNNLAKSTKIRKNVEFRFIVKSLYESVDCRETYPVGLFNKTSWHAIYFYLGSTQMASLVCVHLILRLFVYSIYKIISTDCAPNLITAYREAISKFDSFWGPWGLLVSPQGFFFALSAPIPRVVHYTFGVFPYENEGYTLLTCHTVEYWIYLYYGVTHSFP